MKDFIKCAPSFAQAGVAHGNARSSSSNALSNAGCVKLREAPHSSSIWRGLPVRHGLGHVPLAPLTHQKSKKPLLRHKNDVNEERMLWTIDWTMNWGRDKSYKICLEVQEQLELQRPGRRGQPGPGPASASVSQGGSDSAEAPGGPVKGRRRGRPMSRARRHREGLGD